MKELESRLGYSFSRGELLDLALTHRSANGETGANNERLEFLGDAVLDLALSSLLSDGDRGAAEGHLTKRRAALVNARSLAAKADALGLGSLLRLGKGEDRNRGREKESILSGAFEAVAGAIFVDGGFEAALQVIERLFEGDLSGDHEALLEFDPKTRLQELLQDRFGAAPFYVPTYETGPDHEKTFEVEARLGERALARGTGSSKKAAERAAALRALEEIDQGSADLGIDSRESVSERSN